MGLIKEPLDVDFFVEPKSLSQKEREAISQHIREYKAKMAKGKSLKTVAKNRPVGIQSGSTNG